MTTQTFRVFASEVESSAWEKRPLREMKKRKSNDSLQNQFESLRTDGVVRCIRQKRVFDEERREIKLDHTCRYRISFLKYLRPNLFGSDIPRRKNTCILCSITVIFINLLV